ncbi:MAG: helix-turn-helix domain-containing protein [Clostridium sp.]|jgi:transcriptional regulator with XRE-family HTH domain|nr:helix-turn-helix domain-containing protein [Clostridium sp.]
MNNEKMGRFISELRKSHQMTQRELAAKLNVTDKAVSKWERGLSCPDISLLTPISDIFGITASELLNGEKNGSDAANVEASIDDVLQYADKAVKSKTDSIQNIYAIVFSISLLLGVIVCTICDIAIAGAFTWSLIPISSIVFTWLSFFPVAKYGRKGIVGSLIALSLLIVPFLYVLNILMSVGALLLPIGIRMSVISIAYLWVVFALFKTLKSRKLIASAVSLLLAAPVCLLINFTLSKILAGPLLDIWDVLAFSIIAVAAVVLFIMDFTARKNET